MSKDSKKAAQAAAAKANVENNNTNVNENEATTDTMVEGLEDVKSEDEIAPLPKNANAPKYSDRKWLEENEPEFLEGQISKKFDKAREPKVQAGLVVIGELMGGTIASLILLLGKWWEVKPARAEIKKMIDEEAEKLGRPADHYLQVDLRTNVDKLATIQNAIDRLRYAITYFKPRGGLSSKEVFKSVMINGQVYSVSITKLAEIKEQYPNVEQKAELFAAVIACSTLVGVDEL